MAQGLQACAHKAGRPCSGRQPPVARLQGHEGSISRVRWSSDGKWLASVSDDRSLRIWETPDTETEAEDNPAAACAAFEASQVLPHGQRRAPGRGESMEVHEREE